ncbi:MAG: deoxyribodipyrimidine photo-lyase [Candidatus Scalindua rubra]|uniref:Deoxyribodipyrimidine photo-lyase n=1 Tax=Candidatus Scalindua brodae TaxID=237368 RepID=A0A0B0ELY7_9BACT|nr:MAG: Deoxyribodipyrimidine photo-lyase [Candidatus Scalindua brodae]MBZ0107879.1 deoxyribodipyrimidine photo-lyase [Candidatus Scalindua rubra]
MHEKRVRLIKKGNMKSGPLVYWMSRDQRAKDNWALLFTQYLAVKNNLPVIVVFCLVPQFLGATIRQYHFMLEGLQEVEKTLSEKNINFFLITGLPDKKIPEFIEKNKAGVLITDFSPLRISREWKKEVVHKIDIPCYEIDAHNIVPCWAASPKQEYGAYTFRPKIHRALPEFLDSYPRLKKHPVTWKGKTRKTNWKKSILSLKIDQTVLPVDWLKPGEKYAQKMLRGFLKGKLQIYDKERNDPTRDAQSNLSPYIHFGQISAQRIALEVIKSSSAKELKEVFLEELIVRRELSDNFCYYNPDYDSIKAFPRWSRETLNKHRSDRREYIYKQDQLEYGETHDPLWNAAQMEMVKRGKLHGYMRMYWGKKIIEWTASPEQALKIAIYLNDKYELDGRDPNGYSGIAWCIGGVHDRAWKERTVFGKVRYMNYKGCKSKFDVQEYIEMWLS